MTTPAPGMNPRVHRTAFVAAVAVVLFGPAALFAESLWNYRLHSDDFAYVAASRDLPSAIANLFVPHNTHIVPAWRLLTWLVVRASGPLAHLQATLAVVSYGALMGAMALVGWIASRESGRAWVGLVAMAALGTTSVLHSSATWYSSGQTLWASIGILSMLLCLQGWRRGGGWWRLALGAAWAVVAGGFWTIGHAAGPVGAAYLWADGRRRSRVAALVPLAATTAAVLIALALGGSKIDARISFHGRTEREAANPFEGALHTLQAIPEDLVLQGLGIEAETTASQAAVFMIALALIYTKSLRRTRGVPDDATTIRGQTRHVLPIVMAVIGLIAAGWMVFRFGDRALPLAAMAAGIAAGIALGSWRGLRPAPLEVAGLMLVGSAYFVEWSFRGYLPFSSLRGIVPWYDTIPAVGAVLFGAGWLGRVLGEPPEGRMRFPDGRTLLAILSFQLGLGLLNQARIDALFEGGISAESIEEVEDLLLTPELRHTAARAVASEFADRQRRNLARLDTAATIARREGIGHDTIARAFGRVEVLEIPDVYDANGLLDIPETGRSIDPRRVRALLGRLLVPDPPPRLDIGLDGVFRFAR